MSTVNIQNEEVSAQYQNLWDAATLPWQESAPWLMPDQQVGLQVTNES